MQLELTVVSLHTDHGWAMDRRTTPEMAGRVYSDGITDGMASCTNIWLWSLFVLEKQTGGTLQHWCPTLHRSRAICLKQSQATTPEPGSETHWRQHYLLQSLTALTLGISNWGEPQVTRSVHVYECMWCVNLSLASPILDLVHLLNWT